MHINHFEAESKLYDLLQFPRLLFIKKTTNSSEGYQYTNLDLETLNDSEYVDFMTQAQQQLSPISDELNAYYANEFMSDYDFFNVLTKVYSISGYADIELYVDNLINKDPHDLKKHLIASLILIESDDTTDAIKQAQEKADHMLLDHAAYLRFMKDLSTEETYKWRLMMIVDDPIEALRTYKLLMKKILPIYEVFYQQHQALMKQVIENILPILKQEDSSAINRLTHHMIDPSIFPNEKTKLLVSFVFPYAFMLKSDLENKYIVWGLKMEEGFKKISENYQSELEQRTQIFKNLGDATRYEVLKLIANGITSTKDIAQRLDVSSATISYHINALVTSHLIVLTHTKGKKYGVDLKRLNQTFNTCINDLDIQFKK